MAKRSARANSSGQPGSMARPGRPTHVIVFRRPSEGNISLLAGVMKAKQATGAQMRSAVAELEAADGEHPKPVVYERLGVGLADLSPDQEEKLRRSDEVAVVAANELRSIPPIAERAPAGATSPSGRSVEAQPPHGANPAATADPLTAYLLGMRDAADLALRFRAGASGPADAVRSAPGLPISAGGGGLAWPLEMIGLSESGPRLTGQGVIVAVLDTGIDLTHPDFQHHDLGQAGRTASFIAGETVQDGNGHGTHCCGVVAGAAQSAGDERYSVAPDATLLAGKVLSDAGSGYDDGIIDGIDWAAEQGARVISLSLGSDRRIGRPFAAAYEAIAESLLAQDPGVLLVAAAGNSSYRPWWVSPVGNPAACPSVLAVAAVDRDGAVARFSCGQRDSIGEINLAAPGVAVYSAYTGGGFQILSGTSMATPHVAGAAALYLERDPYMSAAQLWAEMQQRARYLGSPADFGAGLVQVPRC